VAEGGKRIAKTLGIDKGKGGSGGQRKAQRGGEVFGQWSRKVTQGVGEIHGRVTAEKKKRRGSGGGNPWENTGYVNLTS